MCDWRWLIEGAAASAAGETDDLLVSGRLQLEEFRVQRHQRLVRPLLPQLPTLQH